MDMLTFLEFLREGSWSSKYKRSINCDRPKGFSQRAHCAGRAKRRSDESVDEATNRIPRRSGQPAGSTQHSDLYTDENPRGTIRGLKFATVKDAEMSVRKIRASDRSHAHKIQAAIAMEQRAKVAGKDSAAAVYRQFINAMKKKTQAMSEAPSDAAQVQALLQTKELTGMMRRRIQQTLDVPDPLRMRQTLAWLRKQPDAMSVSSTAAFDRLWKARPVFTPSFHRRGEPTSAAYNRYARMLAQYYRIHFGGPQIWTNAMMNRYLDAGVQERPRIRYQGVTYPLTTGMDERDFVLAVVQQHQVTPA